MPPASDPVLLRGEAAFMLGKSQEMLTFAALFNPGFTVRYETTRRELPEYIANGPHPGINTGQQKFL